MIPLTDIFPSKHCSQAKEKSATNQIRFSHNSPMPFLFSFAVRYNPQFVNNFFLSGVFLIIIVIITCLCENHHRRQVVSCNEM